MQHVAARLRAAGEGGRCQRVGVAKARRAANVANLCWRWLPLKQPNCLLDRLTRPCQRVVRPSVYFASSRFSPIRQTSQPFIINLLINPLLQSFVHSFIHIQFVNEPTTPPRDCSAPTSSLWAFNHTCQTILASRIRLTSLIGLIVDQQPSPSFDWNFSGDSAEWHSKGHSEGRKEGALHVCSSATGIAKYVKHTQAHIMLCVTFRNRQSHARRNNREDEEEEEEENETLARHTGEQTYTDRIRDSQPYGSKAEAWPRRSASDICSSASKERAWKL